MNQQPSSILKVVYGLVLLAAILPFGLAESGWVGLVIGGVGLGLVPSLGPLVFQGLAIYRICVVTSVPGTLDSPRATGLPAVLRAVGMLGLYVGALAAVVSWSAGPLMHAFLKTRTDIGVEFFLELYLYMGAGIGILGLTLFEFSRLLAFERSAQVASAASRLKTASPPACDGTPP